jgi:glutaconyl-CoA/methylmalonyl-CoA decarboxylase subunit gamma
MSKDNKQKYRVLGNKEFAFVCQEYSVRKTPKQQVEIVCANSFQATLFGDTFTGDVIDKRQNSYTVMVNGNTYSFQIERNEAVKRKKARGGTSSNEKNYLLKAPMPGKICEVFVSKGILVQPGEPILILEAMKMQNQLQASEAARVQAIHVRKNENVLGDQLLVEMERMQP